MGKKKTAENNSGELIFPLISLTNFVASPSVPQPIKIEDRVQCEYLEKCVDSHTQIFLATSTDEGEENKEENILKLGVVAYIDRVMQMPGAPTLAFVRPAYRAEFCNIIFNPAFPMAKVKALKNFVAPKRQTLENEYLLERINHLFKDVMSFVADPERNTARKIIEENSQSPVHYLYALAHVAPLTWQEKYAVLEPNSYNQLSDTLAIVLDEAQQRISIQAQIHERTHIEISRQQKENFLRIHLKQIQDELGEFDDSGDNTELLTKASEKVWDENAKNHFEKEMRKMRRLNVNNPEHSVQYAYLQSFLDLPWYNYSNKNFSLQKVEEILNRDHYGLEKVKERILEYIAVLKLRKDLKAPILCLYGPPGVGKTSIGKSVAEATGREYARIALGGMHDEAEIRGHRRTYIGAMPGRFLHTLSKCKYGNPLILLDEIDKVGKDYKGDPSSALLEALDPEQNNTFHDNFIDYPYDLSKVLFIATANDISTIPAPLLDRMEIIHIPGYSPLEKREIALRHLIDKSLNDNGFKPGDVTFTPEAIDYIIKSFTHEKGVRQLNKVINRIIRKLALLKVKRLKMPKEITPEIVKSFIDKDDFKNSSLGFRV